MNQLPSGLAKLPTWRLIQSLVGRGMMITLPFGMNGVVKRSVVPTGAYRPRCLMNSKPISSLTWPNFRYCSENEAWPSHACTVVFLSIKLIV